MPQLYILDGTRIVRRSYDPSLVILDCVMLVRHGCRYSREPIRVALTLKELIVEVVGRLLCRYESNHSIRRASKELGGVGVCLAEVILAREADTAPFPGCGIISFERDTLFKADGINRFRRAQGRVKLGPTLTGRILARASGSIEDEDELRAGVRLTNGETHDSTGGTVNLSEGILRGGVRER